MVERRQNGALKCATNFSKIVRTIATKSNDKPMQVQAEYTPIIRVRIASSVVQYSINIIYGIYGSAYLS